MKGGEIYKSDILVGNQKPENKLKWLPILDDIFMDFGKLDSSFGGRGRAAVGWVMENQNQNIQLLLVQAWCVLAACGL